MDEDVVWIKGGPWRDEGRIVPIRVLELHELTALLDADRAQQRRILVVARPGALPPPYRRHVLLAADLAAGRHFFAVAPRAYDALAPYLCA